MKQAKAVKLHQKIYQSKKTDIKSVDIRNYAKYLLQEGSIGEKRELLACLKSELVYKDRRVGLVE